MFLLRLLQIWIGRMDPSQSDPSASGFQAVLLPAGSIGGVSKAAKSSVTSPFSRRHISGPVGKFVNKGAGRNPYQSLPQIVYSPCHKTPE